MPVYLYFFVVGSKVNGALFSWILVEYKRVITGAQPLAGTGHKMQTVSVVFFNVTLLGIYR